MIITIKYYSYAELLNLLLHLNHSFALVSEQINQNTSHQKSSNIYRK